jgi:hypothetical protein
MAGDDGAAASLDVGAVVVDVRGTGGAAAAGCDAGSLGGGGAVSADVGGAAAAGRREVLEVLTSDCRYCSS